MAKASQRRLHVACGYSYIVVRSDGKVIASKVYRGENPVRTFLSDILLEEEKIRESLTTPKPIVMAWKDWEKFKNANDCTQYPFVVMTQAVIVAKVTNVVITRH